MTDFQFFENFVETHKDSIYFLPHFLRKVQISTKTT